LFSGQYIKKVQPILEKVQPPHKKHQFSGSQRDEEEPHIWFHLIEAQFAAAGIKSQKLKYANALASLPKQVLWDILDTLDVCNDSDELFDFLKLLCLGSLERASGNLIMNCFAFPWKCRASSPVFSWKSSNNISLQECHPTTIFFSQCF
jgi:hypothetical protein